jgi:transcriptional regulator with XRE-family HTH domain
MSNQSTKNTIAVERGKRVRFLRSYIAAMTGEEFAEYCGLARGTITNWERGKGKAGLTEKGAKQIVQVMGSIGIACTVAWLLDGKGDIPKITDQNKLSRLHYPMPSVSHSGRVSESGYEYEHFLEEVALFKERYPAHLLYTFQDESMAPIYHTQDCVGGPKLLLNQFGLAQSRICIVLLQSNEFFVRRVRLEGLQPKAMSFYVVNAETALEHPPMSSVPIESIIALAPICRMWRNIEDS